MKVTKKKAQTALNNKIANMEKEKLAFYNDYMQTRISDAEKELASHLADTAHKKRRVSEAKAELAKFRADKNKDKYIPAYYQNRYKFDKQTAGRMDRVQRKIELAEGDTINLTDGELLAL